MKMEIWDGYRRDGSLAGVDLVRGEKIPRGLYVLVTHILVRHADGDYLLMQRDKSKPNYPGYFEATAGGAALKGEDSLGCALRELYEETGIRSEKLEFLGRDIFSLDKAYDDTIYDVYLCVTGIDKSAVRLQDGETIAYKWIDERGFAEFLDSDAVIPLEKLRLERFWRKNEQISQKSQ